MPRRRIPIAREAAVLGVDLSTRCGWAALSRGGDRVASGTVDLPGGRWVGGGYRYLYFTRRLEEILDRYRPRLVCYEAVRRIRGNDAQAVYHGLWASLTALCEGRDLPYVSVEVSEIKRAATGAANANKQRVVAAANARWGLSLAYHSNTAKTDDNEADALWAAALGLGELPRG